MRLLAAAALLVLALPPVAEAKEFTSLIVVGADGRSTTLRPGAGVVDSLFDGGSPLNRGRSWHAVAARGGYVRLYVTGPDGLPGVPGRYYPDSRAACFSWSQAGAPAPRGCWEPNATLRRVLRVTGRHRLFRGAGPALRALSSTRLPPLVLRQLRTAVELALDRSRLARGTTRPAACIGLRAAWRDDGGSRPRRLCLARAGVWGGGRLYPLGPGPWDFARLNLRE
jgi:hypothetical protein